MEDQIRRLHLERLSREDWVLVAVGIVLIFDLLVLPWFSFGATISVGSATVSIGGSLTAVDAPDAWLGVLALLSCAFLVADLGFERLSPQTRVPSIASDRETTRFVLACVAAGLIGLKFLLSHRAVWRARPGLLAGRAAGRRAGGADPAQPGGPAHRAEAGGAAAPPAPEPGSTG